LGFSLKIGENRSVGQLTSAAKAIVVVGVVSVFPSRRPG
jgi:hypothetical protein